MMGNQSTVENAKEKLDRWLKDGITTPVDNEVAH